MGIYKVNSDIDDENSRITLFDFSIGGHHPGYIQHLIKYWCEKEKKGWLNIVVLPEFLNQHPDVVNFAKNYNRDKLQFVSITLAEEASLASRSNFISRRKLAFQEWNLISKYASHLKATHGLLLYFDTCQLPILLSRSFPCLFSGIYFRPKFHYNSFEGHEFSRQEQFHQWREQFHLRMVLRKPMLKNIFCLDPFVVESINQFNMEGNAIYLPDPIQTYSKSQISIEQTKRKLKIESFRKVLLLFGALNARKGLYKLLEAIPQLPSYICQKICILLVGPISSQDKLLVQTQIEQFNQSLKIQIVVENKFIEDKYIHPYFSAADFILAPYQRHVGMSAILVRAAASQKLVLSSNYGLMGEITRRYKLGLTVDSTKSREIAKGIVRLLSYAPNVIGEREKMAAFAEQNSADKFARVIFDNL